MEIAGEIFGLRRMWNNFLAEIVKYLTLFDVKWNSFIHTPQAYFTAEGNFTRVGVFHSFRRNEFHWKKHLLSQVLFSWLGAIKKIFLRFCVRDLNLRNAYLQFNLSLTHHVPWKIKGKALLMQNTRKELTANTFSTIHITSVTFSIIVPLSVRRPIYYWHQIFQEGVRGHLYYITFHGFFQEFF